MATLQFDASTTNESSRSGRIYKDLNLNFTRHPVTGDITRVTDIDAVKRSVRNLVLTNHYERPFHPEIGSNIRATLFEPMTPFTANLLTRQIKDVIENFEPRVELVSIKADPNLDRNAYDVTITFNVVNAESELVELDLLLERIR